METSPDTNDSTLPFGGQNRNSVRGALPALPGGEDFSSPSSHTPVETQSKTHCAEPIDPYATTVMWWSWAQAVQRAHRCGIALSLTRLKVIGRKEHFSGKLAGARTLKFPVNRVAFERWLSGK